MLETDDLFLGALGLVRGGELRAIEVRGTNGRRVAVFRIAGPAMEDAERDYHRGPALVDLRLLKSEVRRLNLGGHLKTGHSWTGQNRPLRGSGRDRME